MTAPRILKGLTVLSIVLALFNASSHTYTYDYMVPKDYSIYSDSILLMILMT